MARSREEKLDWIDQVLRGELNDSEMSEFEESKANDPDLQKLYQEQKAVSDAVKKYELDRMSELLRKKDADMDKKRDARPHWLGTMSYQRIALIAATIVLLAVAGWQLREHQVRQTKIMAYLDEHFEPYPLETGFTRSGDDIATPDISPLRAKAYALYQIEEYREAAEMEQDSMALFYAGVSWLGAGELEYAKSRLTKYAQNTKKLTQSSIYRKLVENLNL